MGNYDLTCNVIVLLLPSSRAEVQEGRCPRSPQLWLCSSPTPGASWLPGLQLSAVPGGCRLCLACAPEPAGAAEVGGRGQRALSSHQAALEAVDTCAQE